jgi:hypothetical protein
MNKKVFWFHYNKPASKMANNPKMTVHHNGICHIVDHIICDVSTYTKHNKRQPHVVLKGKCSSIDIVKTTVKTAIIK